MLLFTNVSQDVTKLRLNPKNYIHFGLLEVRHHLVTSKQHEPHGVCEFNNPQESISNGALFCLLRY